MRGVCDLLEDCKGGRPAYMVWLVGPCGHNGTCRGHLACNDCTKRAQGGVRGVSIDIVQSLPR